MNDLKKKKLFMLDMDGTIYHENTLIPGAKEFFDTLNKQGKNYVFMTNNSSKSKYVYVEELNKFGIDVSIDNIASSVNATVQYLKNRKPNAKLYLVGTDSLRHELLSEGFILVPSDYRILDIDFVLVGFDTELNYSKIEGACYFISRDIEFLATNCDLRCPVKEGKYIPDCGAICQLITAATEKTPIYLGKPNRELVDAVSKKWNVALEDMICIGDRLYTDIAVGINAGVTTAVVFTGEAKQDDIDITEFKPTYCFESIYDIYKALTT